MVNQQQRAAPISQIDPINISRVITAVESIVSIFTPPLPDV